MYRALYISPMIPSYDLGETARFFKELLGFSTTRDDGHYIILYKEKLTIHLLRVGEDIGQMEFYMEVDDVDEVWNLIKDNIGNLKVKAPFDRDYGMREIHISVPATKTLLFIGQALRLNNYERN